MAHIESLCTPHILSPINTPTIPTEQIRLRHSTAIKTKTDISRQLTLGTRPKTQTKEEKKKEKKERRDQRREEKRKDKENKKNLQPYNMDQSSFLIVDTDTKKRPLESSLNKHSPPNKK